MLKNREKLILCGLFLSKFNEIGYKKLGFSSFTEAFNVLGYALDAKPMNIKNYRDEFDPIFQNPRKGWHKREMREYCRAILDEYQRLNLNDFSALISSFLVRNFELKSKIDSFLQVQTEPIKRVATGRAAENYFIQNFRKYFKDFTLTDTREFGCGFDFKMDFDDEFFCVEVKGISQSSGGFLLTKKEFEMAEKFRQNYCLFVVKNLQIKPCEALFFDPLQKFNLKQIKQEITQISYQGLI